ncbi:MULTISPECIES: heme NO-binding domain-containing protein [unclassified Halanaerobium]|uniref:heme NO-binding domain-containing protein n=1 Tax=unclassified Halanaerobium TaxID=2641197 RepID=UPI000DF154CF|nr:MULTISPECIES: heme NO-binding domain-containing protein [unclassified Halanaerobium]RCW48156.1 methyl-accepting chemotaxis protein [Halanaerobium sp. MA284_MarDTE_T2]RCW80418.1 methyl-accepting chemotaxis protein [Halanaerobium sp. DL-01]
MKGTVVSTWLKTLTKTYGEEVVSRAKKKAGFKEDLIITPMTTIEDQKTKDLMKYIGQEVGKKPGEIWHDMGKKNIETFSNWFPSYFSNRTLKNFLMLMDTVHLQLTEMIPGANPPRLRAKELNGHKIEMTYKSKRGMYDYFLGLLEGSSSFFKTPIEVEEIDRGTLDDGRNFLTIHISFEKSFRNEKKYLFSKILGLGIFKSIPAKMGLTAFVLSLALTSLPQFSAGWTINLGAAAGLAIILALISRLLMSPIKVIDDELSKIEVLNLDDENRLKTADDFENLFNKLRQIKAKLREDILFLKGGTDDMHNFTKDFVELAEDMEEVSDSISTVVDEVAQGAQAQAQETEESAYIVNQNVEEIENLVEAGQESRENLENAVKNIRSSTQAVVDVNQRISGVREAFANVNQLGKQLSEKIETIMEIVDTVEDIAGQTNLLSLNASIEAARSSDNGRGFTVVAEEVRELAEESQQAVETIRKNLGEFTEHVETLSSSISEQFTNLEASNQALEEVAESSNSATNDIESATNQVVNIVSSLNTETKKIREVIENFNNLAAIAQENSASSEEMSASVNNYSEKIKEMTGYIEQMEDLTENFRKNLKSYNV